MNAPWATPTAIDNLGVLSRFRPRPPRIQGVPHLSTSASPCLHADIATWFRYDQHSLDLIRNHLTAVMLEAPNFPLTAIAQTTDHYTYNDPLHVQGEAGLVTDILPRLIWVLIPRDVVRQWQQRAGSFDLGLRAQVGNAWLAHCEIKCGYNLDPHDGPADRIVLGPTFFDSLISYLESTGGVAYSETTMNLVDYPMGGEEGLAVFQGRDPSDKENIRRVLCQIRYEICRTQLAQPDTGNRYYLLSTFRHAVLFTLDVDEITVSPVVSIDGECTQDRPLGNVAALFYAISNLPDEMYHVPIPQRDRNRLRDRGGAGQGGQGTGAGAGQGAALQPEGRGGGGGGGGGRRLTGQGLGHDGGPADGLPGHFSTSRVVSDVSTSSASTGKGSYCQTHSAHSSPFSSPVSATFSVKTDQISSTDIARQGRRRLKVDFNLAYNVGGQTLESDPSGPKIVNRGVYLCHPILANIPGLRGPLFSPPLWTEVEPWPHARSDNDTAETDTIVVDGYLGVGATSTVFSGRTDTGRAVAVKYSCPDMYPTMARAGSWDCYQVQEAITREVLVYARLEGLDAGDAGSTSTSKSTLPCAPRWFGSWCGGHRALGHVWCSVMEAGEPVGINTMTPEEKVEVVETYRRLHSLGIIHGDVSPVNLCRIIARGTAGAGVQETTGSVPLQTSSTTTAETTRIVIIDFGLAFITKQRPSRFDTINPAPGGQLQAAVQDEAEAERFASLAANEMAQVVDMVGI